MFIIIKFVFIIIVLLVCKQTKGVDLGENDGCHINCKNGCRGPGPTQCYSNEDNEDNVLDSNTIVPVNCNLGEYDSNGNCLPCHDECKSGCTGPGNNDCYSCKNLQDGEYCRPECPINKYNKNGHCKSCHIQCKSGCTGPHNHHCYSCKNVQYGVYCLLDCPINNYNDNGQCKLCHKACADGCTGGDAKHGAGGCNSCNKIILTNDIVTCLHKKDRCPIGYVVSIVNSEHDALSKFKGKECCRRIQHIEPQIDVSIGQVVVTILVSIIFMWIAYCWRSKKTKRNSNLSTFVAIQESELVEVATIGAGNFGIVFEAIWTPRGTNETIRVAVKTLRTRPTRRSNVECLKEAMIMAELHHSNIVRIIGIIATTDIKLVTKLMPLGCLLNYIRSNERDITPNVMLAWCEQIATGMAYLENKNLVHRDLAARNVLLKRVDCIKIADFGLSKFAYNTDEDMCAFPIPWLALESLERNLFTSKSDVWAFGVTIWEILTFGETPYSNMLDVRRQELAEQLRQGLRLSQPPYCNAQVYGILVSCWLEIRHHRPTFAQLKIDFKRMCDEPENFVAGHE